MIKICKYCTLVIFLFTCAGVSGQAVRTHQLKPGEPFITYYSPRTYNSGRVNWKIIQDKRGIIYAGNESGVLEFDGNSWRKINVPNGENVRAMALDKDGKIFVCAGVDFGYLESDVSGQLKYKSLLPYLDKKNQNTGEIWDAAASSKGVFIKSADKIFHWNGNKIKVIDSVFAFRLYNINDTIYARNHGTGLMMIDGDSLKLMPDGGFFSRTGVFNMLPYRTREKDGRKKILVTTNDKGLFLHDGTKFSPFKTEADEFLKTHQIYNACVIANGNYAFSTQRGGVVIIDDSGKLVSIINKNSNLPSDIVYDVYPDSNGGLWLATVNGIAFCELESAFKVIRGNGLPQELVNSVIRFNGKFYVACEMGVFYRQNDKSPFKLVSGSDKPAYFFSEINGNLFAATNGGLALIENGQFKRIIDIGAVYSLLPSNIFHGRIYAASSDGFLVLEMSKNGDIKIQYGKRFEDDITSIVEEGDGTVWLSGYFPGIYRVSGKMNGLGGGVDKGVRFDFFSEQSSHFSIRDIYNVNNELLLSADEGNFRFDGKSGKFLRDSSLGETLSSSTFSISKIIKINQDELWVLAESEGRKYLGQAVSNNDGKYFWKPNPEFQRIDLNSLMDIYTDISESGNGEKIWLCVNDGLIYYDSQSRRNIETPYSTWIRKVVVNNDSLIYGGSLNEFTTDGKNVLSYSKNNIRFEYAAASFIKPEATLFQYFLEGNDKEWSKWTPESKKEYTNLPKGEYTFKLRSKNVYGVISIGNEFVFQVLSPWYMTYWAYGMYAFIIFSGIFFTDRVMRNKIIKRERDKAKLVEAELRAESAELQAVAAESQSRLIQAENDRKTKELEEARQLQLSMLPKELPNLPNLDIAVYMKTATEVGGDYYDFHIGKDGILTAVVGDATGHGMKAGTIVSMVKALFASSGSWMDVKTFFHRSSDALKGIELGRLMMAFIMLRIKSKTVEFSNAGMPPLLIYKKDTGEVEEVMINGMPLGAMKNFPYEMKEVNFSSGDALLLLSDGLPELTNKSDEQFGYEQVKEVFRSAADKTSNEIINRLKNAASDWTEEKEPDDDVTLVVIKIK